MNEFTRLFQDSKHCRLSSLQQIASMAISTEMKNIKNGSMSVAEYQKGGITTGYEGNADEQSKFRILKNLLMVCLAIFMYQNASLPCKELQSSINMKEGLGTVTVSVQTGCQLFNLIFLPTMFIRFFGLKYTICFSLAIETIYFLTNLYPDWYTLVPGAVVSGLLSMSLWPAKSSYITHVSHLYATKFGLNLNNVVNKFFGLFYMFYYFGYILGNVFSHYVLMKESNATDLSLCGSSFCDKDIPNNSTNFEPPSQTKLYFLFGGFAVMVFSGVILCLIFLDQVRVGPTLPIKEYLKLSLDTLKHFKHKSQILLTPVNFYRGISSGFISADYTKAYVTCAWGVFHVGFVMLTFGACCGVASFVFGLLVKKVGRLPLFIIAACAHVAVIVILFKWKPNPDEYILFFVVSGLWGIGHSVWESQIAALHGILFPNTKEQAFSCYVMVETLGGMIAFAVSASLCVYSKLSMVSGFLAIAFTSFLCVEIPLMLSKNTIYNVT